MSQTLKSKSGNIAEDVTLASLSIWAKYLWRLNDEKKKVYLLETDNGEADARKTNQDSFVP